MIVMAGAVTGLIAAAMATKTLGTFMFGLSERDPLTLTMVTLALVAVAMAAGLLPARRAATLDPVKAIKAE
jgi:ABC-type antimicrobial peptide transport system permease subunit